MQRYAYYVCTAYAFRQLADHLLSGIEKELSNFPFSFMAHPDGGGKEIGIPITKHSKLPDVVLFKRKKNWLYVIEAVTSYGVVSPKRIVELEELLKDCNAGKVFDSAFPGFAEFIKHSTNIAW
jgi:hypothetical protein